MNKGNNLSLEFASIALLIGAIKINLTDPFKWAQGYRMPIYNNNREFLSLYKYRACIVEAFVQMGDLSGIDCIVGTSLAGIPHAVGLSHMTGKPVVIFHDGVPHQIKSAPISVDNVNFDTVLASAPWCIDQGIMLANELGLGFGYIRPKQKTHGLMKMIEGKISAGEKVAGIFSSDNTIETERVIREHGLDLTQILRVESARLPYDFRGKRAVVIEDLVSTGGSSYSEVELVRSHGGLCNQLLTIFDYGFPESKKLFEEGKCEVKSIFSYDDLMRVAREKSSFSKDELSSLEEWNKDPWNWGEKRGFPRIPKS